MFEVSVLFVEAVRAMYIVVEAACMHACAILINGALASRTILKMTGGEVTVV